jgi:hypothetical protein
MELQERVNILTQGVELAQKKGVLSIDDAYLAKLAMDAIKKNTNLKEAMDILIQTVGKGQKNGAYSLKDAHLLYLAAEGYEASIPQPVPPQPVQQPSPTTAEPVPEKKPRTKKES